MHSWQIIVLSLNYSDIEENNIFYSIKLAKYQQNRHGIKANSSKLDDFYIPTFSKYCSQCHIQTKCF